jgi:hypothetical protein
MAACCASGAHDPNGRCAPVLADHHFRSTLTKILTSELIAHVPLVSP